MTFRLQSTDTVHVYYYQGNRSETELTWPAQIVGDVAGHIQHLALDDDFLPLHGWTLENES